MSKKFFLGVFIILIVSIFEVALGQVSHSTVIATGILKMANGTTKPMTIEMTGPNMVECWQNAGHRACNPILWTGSINGRPVGNTSNGGSTYTEHIFFPGSAPYLKIRDCGPYVGACEYHWIGQYNSVTQVYEGTITYWPATYAHLTIYKNKVRIVR